MTMLYANAATDRTTGVVKLVICATPQEIPWKDVVLDWTKIIGDGQLKEHNANAAIDKIAGDATTVIFAIPEEINANAEISKKIGDATNATEISD